MEMHAYSIMLKVTTKFLPLALYPSTLKILQLLSHGTFYSFWFFADIKSEQNNPIEICSILKKARRMTPWLGIVVLLHFGFVWIFFLTYAQLDSHCASRSISPTDANLVFPSLGFGFFSLSHIASCL